MISAYFDTNIFGDVWKRDEGISEQDELKLRESIASGEVSIAFSYLNVEEIAAAPPEVRVAKTAKRPPLISCAA